MDDEEYIYDQEYPGEYLTGVELLSLGTLI